jgi:cardiolipin synthase
MRRDHTVVLLQSGAQYFPALIAAIDASVTEVRFETYIFHFDDVGVQVAQALEGAAKRGVAVFLVMDGIGTPVVPPEWIQRFDDAGVFWHRFSPLGTFGLLIPGRWRRMHRKLCVVDAAVLFCGGINVLDDLFELGHGAQTTPRFDFAVRVTGSLVSESHHAMVQFWQRLLVTRQLERGNLVAARRALHKPAKPAPHSDLPQGHVAASLVLRDNVRNRRSIERVYRQAIAHAKQEVLISNAYFLPGAKLRRALVHATKRGVKVRLLLQGKYEYFMQFHTTKAFYQSLTRAGVEIYEYRAGYLHAKVAVIDGRWATVGSSNLDPLSLLLAREANVVVDDAGFASGLHAALCKAISSQSVRIEEQAMGGRPLLQKCKDKVAYLLMRLTLFLTGKDY